MNLGVGRQAVEVDDSQSAASNLDISDRWQSKTRTGDASRAASVVWHLWRYISQLESAGRSSRRSSSCGGGLPGQGPVDRQVVPAAEVSYIG